MGNEAKRILYVVKEYPSPTETFIEREVRGLSTLGHDIVPWGFESGGLPSLRNLCSTPWGTLWRSLRQDASARRCLGAIARSCCVPPSLLPIHHIHAHFLGMPSAIAFCLARRWNISYSLTAHARDIYVENTPEIVIREARFRTTCTQQNVDYLARRYPGAPFQLIRHGLNPSPYAIDRKHNRTPPCRILFVGRFVEKKGAEYLVQACKILQGNNFPFTCTLIGDGPLCPGIEQQIESLGLSGNMYLKHLVPHDEVIRHYHESDILAAPFVEATDGDRDGVPNVILEAMDAQLAVIATDAGSISEAVRDKETGIIVDQRNPQQLAIGIQTLWHEEPLQRRVVQTAKGIVSDEFVSQKWLDILCELFLSVL